MDTEIGVKAFHTAGGTEDWRVLCDGAYATFRTGSFAAGARFVAAIAGIEGLRRGQPDADVRHDAVTVRLLTMTSDLYGITARDVELARRISGIAREHGLVADPTVAQSILVVPGAPDPAAIVPFWRAALGYEPRADTPEEDLVDPRDRGAPFWFEEMDQPRGDGGGAIHLGIFVAIEEAERRVAAVVAAGGRIVRDRAPMWWTVADAAGNEADIATTEGRG